MSSKGSRLIVWKWSVIWVLLHLPICFWVIILNLGWESVHHIVSVWFTSVINSIEFSCLVKIVLAWLWFEMRNWSALLKNSFSISSNCFLLNIKTFLISLRRVTSVKVFFIPSMHHTLSWSCSVEMWLIHIEDRIVRFSINLSIGDLPSSHAKIRSFNSSWERERFHDSWLRWKNWCSPFSVSN